MTAWLTPARSRSLAISEGENTSTFGSASRPSIRKVVFSSSASPTAPILCKPRTASTTSDRRRALPFNSPLTLAFLAIADLHQFVGGNGRLQSFVIKLEIGPANALPL